MEGAAPVRLLQLTDFHLLADPGGELKGCVTQRSLERAIEAALDGAAVPDAVLATGDLTQNGSRAAYLRMRDMLAALHVPVWCIPGNHDDPAVMAEVLGDVPFSYCGDHVIGTWRVVLLSTWDGDRGGGRLSDQELHRFATVLETSTEPHVLVVLHHHPVASGSWLDKVALENADAFFAVADRCARVRGIVWGHVHQEHDSRRRGVRLLGTPSTCFQFVPGVADSAVDPRAGPAWRWLELAQDGKIATRVGRLGPRERQPR